MNDQSLLHGTGRMPNTGYSTTSSSRSNSANNTTSSSTSSTSRNHGNNNSSNQHNQSRPSNTTSTKPINYYKINTSTTASTTPKTAVITAHKRNSDNDHSSLALDCANISKMLEDGPLKFRILVLLGALFMVIANIIDYDKLQNSANYYGGSGLETLYLIISLYIWLFGTFIITLEMRPFRKGVSLFHRWILEQLSFLRFTWGRGFFYFFSGSLQVALFTQWNMIAGGIMIVLGIASVILGQLASKKLKTLVKKIGNRNNLLDKFKMHDRDHDGYLNVREFRNFVRDMNVTLNDDELTNAFVAIDRDVDRKITFLDLSKWYANAKFDVKTDGVMI